MRNYFVRRRDDGRAARRVLAMPVPRRNGWFDDEVAIDFPSLHGAVERMRESFVAASTDSDGRRQLSAELILSPREAFDGVTVPLDVPYATADNAGLQFTYCFLDDDPVETAARLHPALDARWAGGAVEPLLAAPFHTLVPHEWERYLP